MPVKDFVRAKRLNEVYKYLFAHDQVKSQTDFADKLKIQRTGLNAAMNGSLANLTKNLFMKVCATFPGVFSMDYLLTGNGQLLTENETKRRLQPEHNDSTEKQTEDILEIYAQRIRLFDDLKLLLRQELEAVQSLKIEYQQARDDFRSAMQLITKHTKASFHIAAEDE